MNLLYLINNQSWLKNRKALPLASHLLRPIPGFQGLTFTADLRQAGQCYASKFDRQRVLEQAKIRNPRATLIRRGKQNDARGGHQIGQLQCENALPEGHEGQNDVIRCA